MLLPRPLHSTTNQASRSFTLPAVPFNHLICHQESPYNFLLSSQTPPPTWPQRMASGSKRHPPEKAPLGSPGELAGMKDISEASQGQVGTIEGATSPGYVSFVLQATSLHCQQKSKGENSTWFYRLLRTKLPWGEFSVVDGVLRPWSDPGLCTAHAQGHVRIPGASRERAQIQECAWLESEWGQERQASGLETECISHHVKQTWLSPTTREWWLYPQHLPSSWESSCGCCWHCGGQSLVFRPGAPRVPPSLSCWRTSARPPTFHSPEPLFSHLESGDNNLFL